jgi:hypothetical protein
LYDPRAQAFDGKVPDLSVPLARADFLGGLVHLVVSGVEGVNALEFEVLTTR